MKNKINIEKLFNALDEEMRQKLSSKIDEIYHPTAKGSESELNWIGLLRSYLPERYSVDSGFIVDHEGNISEQIDIIVYDRHFTPFIVFEVRPKLSKSNYEYAAKKHKSVKELKRTSASFTHILGTDKKVLFNIIGGILTKENGSQNIYENLKLGSDLAIVLCLDSGVKVIGDKAILVQDKEPILAFFLLKLIEQLRLLGSVPALEVDKYLSFVVKVK